MARSILLLHRRRPTTTRTTRAAFGEPSGGNNNNNNNVVIIILPEQRGNAIHLHTAVRKYTGATLTVVFDETTRQRRHVAKVEVSKLYDALGLLRSLRYDVERYNNNNNDRPSLTKKYTRFRLTRQAAAFGVRLDNDTDTIVSVPGLDSLIAYVEQHHAEAIATARATIAAGLVDFDGLAEYMTPGTFVVDRGVATGMGSNVAPTLLQVRACYYARGQTLLRGTVASFHVALEMVVAAGDDRYLVVEYQQSQSPFTGTRCIASSSSSVDMFTLPSEQLLHDLTQRGEWYQTLCGGGGGTMTGNDGGAVDRVVTMTTGSGRMVQYSAGSFLAVGGGGGGNKSGRVVVGSRSGGRLMVDPVAAWQRGVHCAVHHGTASDAIIGSLKLYHQTRRVKQQKRQQEQEQRAAASTAPASSSLTMDNYATTASGGDWANDDGDDLHDLLVLSGPLPHELLALTWPVVPGFSLATRSWGVAVVDGLSPIRYDDTVFDNVVLPPSRKRLIRALVASHDDHDHDHQYHHSSSSSEHHKKSADLIAGKGEGSIFLLYGPPGVGKTLTAEAIAEMLHKPLYVVSMGELGTTPESLEARLQDIFDLCVPWQALVLIDEAEMLLERRSKHDIVRNAMVCVMLRLLEYYSGILFLTTNRVESIDPAFQSRVTCALRYDPLTVEARAQIWTTMLRQLDVDITTTATDIDVAELARADINGRQIKNTVQLAAALARHDRVPVGQTHLRETLAVTTSFLQETTYGASTAVEL